MPRIRKSVKDKVEMLVVVAQEAADISAKHAVISARFAEVSKMNARKIREIMEQQLLKTRNVKS